MAADDDKAASEDPATTGPDTPEGAAPDLEAASFVLPVGRSTRAGRASLHMLPRPEPRKRSWWLAILGIGLAMALAAVPFLVPRPAKKPVRPIGGGPKPEVIAIGFLPGQVVVEVDAVATGQLAVLLATPAGTSALGLCEAKTCLVMSDTVPLRVGKTTARATLPERVGPCGYIIALSAPAPTPASPPTSYVDPHAAAKALGIVVSPEACALGSIERLPAIARARHVAFMKVP